jgi:dienelactone hydrolase
MYRLILSFVSCIVGLNCLAQDLPYYPSPGIIDSKPEKTTRSYERFNLDIHEIDPATQQKLVANVHYFKNRKTGKLPLLIMVPAIRGISGRERSITNYFLKQGYHVAILEPVKNIINGTIALQEFQNTLLSFVGAVRSTIDVMIKKEEVDSNNVFLWGSSWGAIYSTIVFGADKRVNAAVIIAGGGSLPDIVTESKQEYVEKYRKERMKQENLATEEAFRQKMKEYVTIDPVDFARRRGPEEVYYVMSLKDKSVPTDYQDLLLEAFVRTGNKKKYRKGHAMTLMLSHYFHHKVYSDFFNKRLRK